MAKSKMSDFDWFRKRLSLITESEIFRSINDGSFYEMTFRIGEWTVIKELFLAYYAPQYVKILKDRRSTLNYVDFFSGSGVVGLKGTKVNFPGSPLIVAGPLIKEKFTNYYFVDNDSKKIEQLKRFLSGDNYKFYNSDANEVVNSLAIELGQNDAHSLIFIDPFAMEFKFNSILALKNVDCDLIITFSAEEISRAINQWIQNQDWKTEKLDDFFGDSEWKKDIDKKNVEHSSIEAYLDRILNKAMKRKATAFPIKKTIGGHYYLIVLVSTGGSREGPTFHRIATYFNKRINSIDGEYVRKILDTYVVNKGNPIDQY